MSELSPLRKIPLKTFWEAVEQRLAACSVGELRAILRAMAQETPPAGRQAFLERLERAEEQSVTVEQNELLADIDDLIRELDDTMAGADDGEEEYGWGGYDDEDSLGQYETFVEPLTALFDRAEAAFDSSEVSLARAAYEKLFEALGREDDYGRGVELDDLDGVDDGESCARYVRAVYETEPPERRPQALFEHMQYTGAWRLGPRLTLDDVIQISPRPLPDRDSFLADWIAFLRAQEGGDADAWLREAIRISQGTHGLEALARDEGKTHPRAYLDWFAALEEEDRHREVLLAAREALQTLPPRLPIRAEIADHVCAAAQQLNETQALRDGRWEAFLAKPILPRLLDLRDAFPAGEERATTMQRAVQHVRDYRAHPPARKDVGEWDVGDPERAVWVNASVLAHACLLAGDFEGAHQVAAAERVLGWSSGYTAQGLVVSFFLVLLSGNPPDALPPNLAQIWAWGLLHSVDFWISDQGAVRQRLGRAYVEQCAAASLGDDRQQELLDWCLDVARQRVDAIVGGQRRKSYDKAAVLTVACAETLRLRGEDEAARALVSETRERFPRHRAFQDEMDRALGDSS
jgi:hypothetical protein